MSEYLFTDPKLFIPEQSVLPRPCEWAWDFSKADFKRDGDGKLFLVYDKEAIKVWLWKLFMTVRFRELIFSFDYGSELENLIGQGYTKGLVEAEAKRFVKEAVSYNLSDYVTDVRNIEVSFSEGTLTVSFTAVTDYGEVYMNEFKVF